MSPKSIEAHNVGKQYHGLEKVYRFDKKEDNDKTKNKEKNHDKTPTIKRYNKSNYNKSYLIYTSTNSFYKLKLLTTFLLNQNNNFQLSFILV